MKINIKRRFNVMNVAIAVFAIAISIFMLVNDKNDITGHKIYFLVPFLYGCLVIGLPNLTKCYLNTGCLIFSVINMVKYLLLPLLMSIGNYVLNRGLVPSAHYINKAILLIIYEMVAVNLVFSYCIKKYNLCKVKNIFNSQCDTKSNNYLIFAFLLFAVLVGYIFKDAVNDYKFVLDATLSKTNSSGLVGLILEFGKQFLTMSILLACKKNYDHTRRFLPVVLSVLAVGVNCLILVGLSRWTVVICALIYLIILVSLYPKYKLLFIVGGLTSIVLLYLYITKKRDLNVKKDALVTLANMLKAYFSGTQNVAVGIMTQEKIVDLYGKLHFNTVISDMLGSVAGFSGIVDKSAGSVNWFNALYYSSNISKDQIIPLINQSGIVFSIYLAPIIPMFYVWIMAKLDSKLANEKNIFMKYVLIYAIIWLARMGMVNSTIINGHIINTSILMYLIVKFNEMTEIWFNKRQLYEIAYK